MTKSKYKKRQATFFALTVVPLLLYITLFIVPVFMGIQYSLTDWNGLSKDYKFVGLANYIKLFVNKRTLKSLAFTGRYTVLLVLFIICFSDGTYLSSYLCGNKETKNILPFDFLLSGSS